jgi:hypothetical protein
MRIEISPPTPDQVIADRRLLARYGLTTPADILMIACYGTAENPRRVMAAAGRVVLATPCHCCRVRKLDPSDKDAASLELCRPCLDEAELENEHSDYGHDTPVKGCPSCPEVTG